jgi:hypothetical protein
MRDNPTPMPPCWPQIPHRLARNWIWASMETAWWLQVYYGLPAMLQVQCSQLCPFNETIMWFLQQHCHAVDFHLLNKTFLSWLLQLHQVDPIHQHFKDLIMKTQLVSANLVCMNRMMWLSAYYLIFFSVRKVQGISISRLDFIFHICYSSYISRLSVQISPPVTLSVMECLT